MPIIHSLISAILIRCLEKIKAMFVQFKLSIFYIISVAEFAGLSHVFNMTG